jgi:microcystin-dependent protein
MAHGKAIVGIDENDPDFRNVGNVARGAKTHMLSAEEMPYHQYEDLTAQATNMPTDSGTGGGTNPNQRRWSGEQRVPSSPMGNNQSHNNIQPSFALYIFRRTA